MRIEDLEALKTPYDSDDPNRQGKRFAEAIGVKIDSIRSLRGEIFSDFSESTYGVSWWSKYRALGTKRRILISDHLLLCTKGIEDNLIEAKLHLMEARDTWDRQNQRMANSVTLKKNGKAEVKIPRHSSPFEELPDHLSNIHIAGFVRGIGSALDCLGGSIIGVLGLPYNLLKSDFKSAERTLIKIAKSPKTDAEKWQAGFLDIILERGNLSSPNEWLEWTTDYRNMLIHRARRTQTFFIEPRPIVGPNMRPLVDPRGIPAIRTAAVRKLPTSPDLSDIESLLPPLSTFTLSEDADMTLSGIIESTMGFAAVVGDTLKEAWNERRKNPRLVEQPRIQWPKIPAGDIRAFRGYTTGSGDAFSQAATSSEAAKRLKCASMTGEEIKKWSEFD